jgi:hypothetical protein
MGQQSVYATPPHRWRCGRFPTATSEKAAGVCRRRGLRLARIGCAVAEPVPGVARA